MLFSNLNNKNLSILTNGCTASYISSTKLYSTAKPTLPSFSSTAIKVFSNPGLERKEISSYLRGKTGIYCFWNKSNGKLYIGSGVELSRRINLYLQNSWLKRHTNMIIVKSILKNGIDNFSLFILEFCDRENLLSRETHFISTLNPAYNIYKIAGSPLGYKHTPQSIAKIRKVALGRTFTKETIVKMSEAAKNRFQNGQPGFSLSIVDLLTNKTTEYISIAQAARKLGLNRSAISQRFNKEIASTFKYKGRYIITVKRP